MMRKIVFVIFAILCVSIGLYPLLYFLIDRTFGLLASKSDMLLGNVIWNMGFYAHIIFGGIALLIGWLQFSKKLRLKKIKMHRFIGEVYTIVVIISGLASLYIAYFATGGILAKTGFMCLGIIWLYSTFKGFLSIRKGKVNEHQKFMIISYAACFAAVTLRLWLPLLISIFQDFVTAYRIVAWLCWVPNILVAFYIIKRKQLNLISE